MMFDFLISLIIFILFGVLGGFLAFKIPKLKINIPEPIIMFLCWGTMIASFYYEHNRPIQILISFVLGFVSIYLLECNNENN